MKALIAICSFCYLLVAVQLYFLSWKMQKYQHSLDNSEQYRLITAKKTLAIGEQQSLIRVYSDAQALRGVIGISADRIPDEFDPSLYKAAHYWPDKITSFYYLIKQCDIEGKWSANDWLYYKQLDNYYPNNLVTYSILLSMTTGCEQVYDVINRQCQNKSKQSDAASLCSINPLRAGLEK